MSSCQTSVATHKISNFGTICIIVANILLVCANRIAAANRLDNNIANKTENILSLSETHHHRGANSTADWNNRINLNDINEDLNAAAKDQFYQSSVEIISTEHIAQACIDKCPQENFTNTEHTSLGCGEDCYNKQYHLGCSLWESALFSSCQVVCNQTDDDLIQLKDVYCTMGCNNALKRYFKWLRNEIKTPSAPALVADTLTATSLSLEWNVPIKLIALTHETYTPTSYLVQWRYETLDEDWKFCKNQSIDYDNATIVLDGLKPYTKYRFRVSIPLSPNGEEILVSHQSIIISTLADGVPTSQPIIVRTVAVDHTRISVSWEPGPFPNGPLLSYSLEIKLISSEGYYSAFKEISASENISFYIFDKLLPANNYSIEISMRNAVGEGPKAKRSIRTLDAPSLYQNEPEPKLILGTEYSVMFQDADILSGNSKVFYHSEHKLLGIAVHIAKSLLFVADATKRVIRTTLGVHAPTKTILTPDSENVNFVPSLLTIDWLNDHLYILAKLEHSKSQYQISRCNLDGSGLTVAKTGLTTKPSHIQVDPVNGFLYWIIPGSGDIDAGLYKMDLADISNGVKRLTNVYHLLKGENLGAFVIDFNKFKLLVPALANNNVYSVSFDGNNREEIRNNTQKPQLSVVKSLAMANGIFYWTNGISLFTEDHHEAEDKYYHNSFPIIQNETFISVAVNLPSSQPMPVPVSPPREIQALLSSTTAKVTWDIPYLLGHQGKGAWQKWEYVLKVMDSTIVHHSFVNITETQYTVYNLKPDTNYTFLAAAYTSSGYSPYSTEFKAKTLKSSEDRYLFWSSNEGLYQTDIIGENATLLKSFTDLTFGSITDIEWFEDLLFFVSNSKLTILNRTANNVMSVSYANEVENIGIDWIGRKIYWSSPMQSFISRSNFDGQNREYILPTYSVKEIRIDSLNGHIYYSTGNSIEACHLNGKDKIHYTTFQHSTGYIMGLTLDIESEKLYWIGRRYGDNPDLYIANMANAWTNDRSIQQIPLGTALIRQDLPSNFLTHFSDRLLWMQNNSTVIVGDISGENLAKLSLMYENKVVQLQSISVLDPSHRLYPKGIARNHVNVIPETIEASSIRVEGLWNAFNITWSPIQTVNYGRIFYEIKVQVKPQNDSIEIVTPNDTLMPYFYYSAGQIMPYTMLTINIRAYTYWAASKFTTLDLYSPAAAPSEPTKERIFITHSHNPFTGGRNITATLRWNPPERPNGLIKSYSVYGWYKVNGTENNIRIDNINAESIVIPSLLNNITYYFQIQAFTSVEGGNRTFPLYVNSSVEQPIPRLLVAEANRIEEFDLDLNQTRLVIHTGYPVNHLAYIDLEKRIFWIDDNNLVSLKAGDKKQMKLAIIYNEVLSLTVDWIQRFAYWSQTEIENGLRSSVYRLDLNQFEGKPLAGEKLHSSSNFIKNLTISPFDQKLFWLEFEHFGSKFGRPVQYDLNENAEMELEDQIRSKCNRSLIIKSMLLDTPSWKENNLVLINVEDQMYMYGLRSQTCGILTKEKYSASLRNSVKQIVKDSDNIYIIRNDTIIIRSSKYKLKYQVFYDKRITHALAFSYQSYPSMQCLLPKRIRTGTETPQLIKSLEHTLRLKLPLMDEHPNCALHLTGIKYIIEYAPLMSLKNENSTNWRMITAFKSTAEIKKLNSFTRYIIRVSVSNYYAEILGLKMFQSDDVIFSTAPGPPSSPRHLEVEPVSPTEALVSWLKPLQMNSDSIWYEIHFETESNKQQSPITEDKFILDPLESDRISFKLTRLLPSHQYTLWILAYSSNYTYASSERVEIEMFDEPDNMTVKEIGSTFLKLHWVMPKDVGKYILECNIKGNRTVTTVFDSTDISRTNMDNEHNYMISDLEPKTTYRFSARLFYSKHAKSYVWPPDDRFYFETLGDCPSQPGKPRIIPVGGEVIKISWDPARDNGAFIEEYSLEALSVKSLHRRRRRSTEETLLLEKSEDDYEEDDYNLLNATDSDILNNIDPDDNSTSMAPPAMGEETGKKSDKWFIYCNVTENHCIKHDRKINEYTLRVRARNSFGWGAYSLETEAISEPYSSPQRRETLVLAIGIPVLLGSFILIFCSIFVHHRCKTPKKILQQANNRFMDVELANLRELPRGGNFIQQTNILYMPHPLTDADIALLPQIRREQVTMSDFLGSGAFGEVYEGVVRTNDNINIRVAVKTLRKGASEQEKFEFLQEAQLMSNFKHEHILRLIGVCFDRESLFIIMELMQGGDLLSYLRSSRPQNGAPSPLNLLDLISICVDVASGCRYLEEMHFVHRDLACRNCLVSAVDPDERVVKIGDFGLARDIYKSDYYRKEGEGLLPVRWMSPESLVDGVFTSQSDIWAFGVLCWEIMTLGQQPYPARNNFEVLHYVRDGGRLERPAGCPEELYQLMLKCWSYRPANRPTFRYCLQILELLKESTNKSYQLLCNGNSNRLPNGDIFNPSYLGSDFNHNQNNIFKDSDKFCVSMGMLENCDTSSDNLDTSVILTPASSTMTIIPKYLEILYDDNAIPIIDGDISQSLSNACEPYEIPISSKELVVMGGGGGTASQHNPNISNSQMILINEPNTIECPTTYSFTSPTTILKSLTTFAPHNCSPSKMNGNILSLTTSSTPTTTMPPTTNNEMLSSEHIHNNNNNMNKYNNNNNNNNKYKTNYISKQTISNSSALGENDNSSSNFLSKRLSNSSCSNNNNNNNNNNNDSSNCNDTNNISLLNPNQILKVNLPLQNTNNNHTDKNKINYKKLYKDSVVVNITNNTSTTRNLTAAVTNNNNENNNVNDEINDLDYNKNSKELINEDGRILVSS